jgi:enterochelin esterase-like enzyme
MEYTKHKCTLSEIPILLLISLFGIVISPAINSEYTLRAHTDPERFGKFLERIQTADTADEKIKLVDGFLESLTEETYPIIENDTTACLIYRGSENSISLLSDLTDWTEPLPMNRVPGTDISYIRLNLPPDARIEYQFLLGEGSMPVPDPLNKRKIYYAIWYTSELAMPMYDRHPFFDTFLSGLPGPFDRLRSHEFRGKIMGYPHTVHVYLPPGYDSQKQRYPVLYFQDGSDYIESAYTPGVLDMMIRDRMIRPVIAVFVTPPNRHQPRMPNRMTEYGMNDDYVRFFTDELVPFIDEMYRTKRTSIDRLVIGDSYAGLISAYIAFSRPDVFGNAYSQSGYFSFNQDRLIELFRETTDKPVRLFIDIGTYERKVAAQILPEGETDFLSANRRMRDVLTEKGYEFVYREFPEGHTWGNWRRRLMDALIHYYGISKVSD